VVLADDDVLLREGLAGLLERSGFEVAGRSGTANELLELVRDLRPHPAIVDIRMPPTHTSEGLEAATRIRAEFPDTAIVVLTAHVQVERATELLAGGRRSGYLLKTRVTIRRIALADRSAFGTNPVAGLEATRSATSVSACVEIKITVAPSVRPSSVSLRARSMPLSSPRKMSTRTTFGRSSST
jgi:DNA-binding NarL/FixJ family response regulator